MRCPQCEKLMRLEHGHEMDSCDVAHEIGGRECKERQVAQSLKREADLKAVNANLRTRIEAEGKRADEAEADAKRLEEHDVEMGKWLESKSYALALALGVPGDAQTPPTDEMIERVKRLREALEAIRGHFPLDVADARRVAAEALAAKEA